MVWWVGDPARLQVECEAIARIDEDWFENPEWSLDEQRRLRLIFEMVLPHRRFRLAMTYHNTFPASPPSVRPIGDAERISGHQYGVGGELCLSIRSDNWSPDVTGADMIRSAYSLLEMETPNEDGEIDPAPSAHDVPVELAVRHAGARFYIDPFSCQVFFRGDPDGSPIEVALDPSVGSCYVAHILSIGSHPHNAGPTIPIQAPPVLRETHLVYAGRFFIVDSPSTVSRSIKTVDQLHRTVGHRASTLTDSKWSCVIRTSDQRLALFLHLGGSDDLLTFDTIYAPSDPPRSGLDRTVLAKKRVGIVGLGSLGSKVAASLGRSGVGRFELVDVDILHSGNLERHDGDWRDVGRHKAQLTARRLHLIAPDIEALPWTTSLGAQVSAEEAGNVRAALAACDLLVDATANPDVFNHLALIATRNDQPLVWAAVYAGGLGGEIARSRPGKDPSPYDIRQAMTQFYDIADERPPLAAGRGYDGSVGQDRPLIATDADVSVFAAHMTAYALDALVDHDPSTYSAPAYFIGLKRGWLFEGPFDTRPLTVDAPVRKPSTVPKVAELDIAFLSELLGE